MLMIFLTPPVPHCTVIFRCIKNFRETVEFFLNVAEKSETAQKMRIDLLYKAHGDLGSYDKQQRLFLKKRHPPYVVQHRGHGTRNLNGTLRPWLTLIFSVRDLAGKLNCSGTEGHDS